MVKGQEALTEIEELKFAIQARNYVDRMKVIGTCTLTS